MIHNNGITNVLWGNVWGRYRWRGSLNDWYYIEEIKAGSGSLFLFSNSLASCLPAAASHAAVSPCWSLKMVPYMAASKPGRSSISLGLVWAWIHRALTAWIRKMAADKYVLRSMSIQIRYQLACIIIFCSKKVPKQAWEEDIHYRG